MNDQDSPKNNNPRIRNVFSFMVKLVIFLKKRIYTNIRVIDEKGIIFEVISIKIVLYFFELNKYFIPSKVFNEIIAEIWSV